MKGSHFFTSSVIAGIGLTPGQESNRVQYCTLPYHTRIDLLKTSETLVPYHSCCVSKRLIVKARINQLDRKVFFGERRRAINDDRQCLATTRKLAVAYYFWDVSFCFWGACSFLILPCWLSETCYFFRVLR